MKTKIAIAAVLLLINLHPSPSRAQGEPLQDLGTLLHQVEEKSPDLATAQARLQSAQAAVRIARSRYFGKVELSARDSHFNEPRPINQTLPPITDKNQFDYGAALTLPIDINGRITAQYKAQKHLSDASSYNAENIRLVLFAQTANFYRGLQKLAGERNALSEQKKALEAHYKLTQAAISAGRTAKVKLLRVKAEISAVEGKIARLHGDEQALNAGLAALLDQDSFDVPLTPILNAGLPVNSVMGKTELVADTALPSRPDILAAESEKKAGYERLKDAQREWLPELEVQGFVGQEKGYDTDSQDSAIVMVQLSWELWDGGQRFATTDKASADLAATTQAKRAAQNLARAEIRTNKAAWRARSAAYNAAKTGLVAAEETARIQGDLYENGRISAVDLVDAETVLADARSNLTGNLADWWLADDQLNIALGRPPSSYNAK